MNGLSLFTGIGGLDVALSEYVRTIAYCEIDTYCQGVLFSRMADELLPNCPVWDDIKTLDGNIFKGAIDIIYGGFPCQDISIAGNGKGLEGERSGLFFEMLRLAKEIKPKFIFLENVPPIAQRGGIQIINEIAEMGYDSRWCVMSAASVGAPHKRERWFLLAHSNSESSGEADSLSKSFKMVEKARIRHTGPDRRAFPFVRWSEGKCPSVAMDDGFPFELDQARALGNAVVPAQAKKAFKMLMGIKNIK